MAGKTITMIKLKQIIRLRSNDVPLQTIAKAVGISRNTVKKYLQVIQSHGYSIDHLLALEDEELDKLLKDPEKQSAERMAIIYARFPQIKKELERVGVNRWLLWGEYKKEHPDGYSYSQFCEHLRLWLQTSSASMHQHQEPADKLFIDFAGDKLHLVDRKTGELTPVEVYISVLGYSQYTYVEAVPSQKKEDLIQATENSLHYFGGVPKVLVPDNLKSAVTKASKYEAQVNAAFMDFANHYQVAVLPARSYKPQDKSLVEKTVSIVYSRIYAPLRNQVFHDLRSLNQAILALLEEHNQHHFQRRKISRKEIFEAEERPLLKALPAQRYELKQYKIATVMKTAHVHLHEDKHYYSVPYRYIGKKAKLVYTSSYVAIFYNKERIAYHQRNYKQFGYSTIKDHMPSAHQFVSEWNPEKFIRWAANIHPQVEHYIKQILNHYSYPEQAYRSCVGILSLDKKVGRQRLINAVGRASEYGSYNYTVVQRILRNGLDQLEEETISASPVTHHENIRGAKNYY